MSEKKGLIHSLEKFVFLVKRRIKKMDRKREETGRSLRGENLKYITRTTRN